MKNVRAFGVVNVSTGELSIAVDSARGVQGLAVFVTRSFGDRICEPYGDLVRVEEVVVLRARWWNRWMGKRVPPLSLPSAGRRPSANSESSSAGGLSRRPGSSQEKGEKTGGTA